LRLCQKPQTIPFTSESALALFCFALLDNSPATTTLLCSYWTYGIRVIFSVTARITTNINTKTKQKIPYPNTSSCTFTHSLGDASSRLSFQRHADQHTNTHGRHFREPFLSRRREQHQHRNRSWSDLAWRREGLAGKGGRAVFAEGSCFFFFLWKSFLRIVLLPHYFKSRIYPQIAAFLSSSSFWISWTSLIFSYLNPLSYVDSLLKRLLKTVLTRRLFQMSSYAP
jgi:hypothetical protein